MKTIKQIQSEIDDIKKEMIDQQKSDSKESKRRLKKLKTELSFCAICLLYIKSDPSPEFVKKEKDRVTNRINMTLEKYVQPSYGSISERKKDKREYEKSMDIPKLRKQLSTLYYLLK